MQEVSWSFVEEENVPNGPWKDVITTSKIRYQPSKDDTFYIQLQGNIDINQNKKIYDIDLFDSDESLIEELHNREKIVICYFSAGSFEDWREDKDDFSQSVLGNELDGWEGEKWLDIRADSLKSIMKKRLDLALSKGCDGVDPDNMNVYLNDSGFDISSEEQLEYNIFIAQEARKRGLSVGLKNDIEQIDKLQPYFDFAVNEQCNIYNECDKYKAFLNADKPVFNLEYDIKYKDNVDSARDELCKSANEKGLTTLILPLALDNSFAYYCK